MHLTLLRYINLDNAMNLKCSGALNVTGQWVALVLCIVVRVTTCCHEWSLARERKKRSLGRSRGRREDGITISVQEIGCANMKWNQVIQVCDQ